MACIEKRQNSIAVKVHVQPRASRTEVKGMHNHAVKICVTAPPVDNKANIAVIQVIAELFKVPKSAVSIKSGMQGRHKTVLVNDITIEEAQETLAGILSKA